MVTQPFPHSGFSDTSFSPRNPSLPSVPIIYLAPSLSRMSLETVQEYIKVYISASLGLLPTLLHPPRYTCELLQRRYWCSYKSLILAFEIQLWIVKIPVLVEAILLITLLPTYHHWFSFSNVSPFSNKFHLSLPISVAWMSPTPS